MADNPAQVLDFWYHPDQRSCWFNSTPELDARIRTRFEPLWQRAAAGELAEWNTTPEGALALVILLDQMPLNMFRGEARSFSTEQQAVAVCKHAVAQGFDQRLPLERRAFLYMPLMHSEHLPDQELSVSLFASSGLTENLRYARHHQELIHRFGRFPHRNAILGRASTPEEIIYLASPEAFLG